MSSSRFKVNKVSESGEDQSQSEQAVNELTTLVQHENDNSATKEFIVDATNDQKNVESSPKASHQANEHAPGPTGDDGITFSVTDKEDAKANLRDENKEASKKEKGEGRFHVEFVDPIKDSSNDDGDVISQPTSPSHDSSVTHNNTHSKTYYLRTFGHNTQEAIPMVEYYQNSGSGNGKSRPTLEELHQPKDTVSVESPKNISPSAPLSADPESGIVNIVAPIKFGWIKGVLVRCLLNIWGVMLFLRLSWCVGQAGIGFTVVIILLAGVVTSITTMSMSAICTNGQVKGGGAYYLISRSLGPEFGGAIGIIFSLANAVAVAMYVVGFAETVVDLMTTHGATITGNEMNDIRIVGAITVVLLLGITQLGMAWEAKAQLILLFILLVAMFNFVIGTFIPATEEKESYGFFNYQGTIAAENFGPQYTGKESFFSIFSIFFPAATGILAGCNISGDLKNAQTAIPKGTFLAIAITTVVYAGFAVILGCIEVRDASGNYLANNTDFVGIGNVTNCTTGQAACDLGWQYTPNEEGKYPYGLLNDFQAMQKISGFGPIIIAGIFAATLSSALASLVGAPKIFQAVCRDKIFPGIEFFGKGTKGSDEPRRAYVLAFLVGLGFILIGELNAIAPIISNFFLASYTLINYSCFAASLAKSPGWRPAFKYYNMWVALIGSVLCLAVMFLIQWWAALITIVIVIALYKFVDYKKPDVNWGSSAQAFPYVQALNSSIKLAAVEDHVKNFRPQTLVLTGSPSHRPALVHFASHFTKNVSLMVCGNIRMDLKKPYKTYHKDKTKCERWLKEQKIKSFYTSVTANDFKTGSASLMQCVGLGKMQPNTVLIGFKNNWRDDIENICDYMSIITNAFDFNLGVCILRLQEGFDISPFIDQPKLEEDEPKATLPQGESVGNFSLSEYQSESAIDLTNAEEAAAKERDASDQDKQEKKGIARESSAKLLRITKGVNNKEVDTAKLKAANQFKSKQDKGKTIDVWWLFDDGGLTILLPYLLSNKQQWSNCKLRIFTGGKQSRIDKDKRTMAQLLSKFRIEFHDVTVIGDIGIKPKKPSMKDFDDMIKPFLLDDGEWSEEERKKVMEEKPWKISDGDIETLKEKTNRQIRLHELLLQHSSNAALIIMTLPMARKGTVPAALYLAWLEELSRDLPPMLMMRGNQSNVLTFYS